MIGRIRAELTGYWLCGSGRGDGPGADELPITNRDGLPFVPGRTLRGLLRDAVRLLVSAGACEDRTALALFGSEPWGDAKTPQAKERVPGLEQGRYTTEPGALRLTSAVLGRTPEERTQWRLWARHTPDAVAQVFVRLGSTRVNASGVADDQTLRTVAVVVPMTLYADIEVPDELLAPIREALPLVRGLGSGRHRGLGRAQLTLEEGRSDA